MSTHHQDWIPANREARYDQAIQTWTYLSETENRSRMGFGAGTMQGTWVDTEFSPKYNTFLAAFQGWKNPAERTPTKTVKLNEAEDAFVAVYRQLYTGFLKSNPLVTNDDLQSMGMPLRNSSRTPARIPDTNPDADTDTSQMRRVKISFYENDGIHKKGKPDGVHGAEILWEVLDTFSEVHLDDLKHSSFDTRTPFVLDFTDEQRGKILYFALRWENTRGQKGPFGPILNAVIP
ncbi:MAG: hypothetical protein LBB90_07560 [Tannerella sp.]|jgi:hypothetical protein|nr:hypothetical protein [Tannerella sp.]